MPAPGFTTTVRDWQAAIAWYWRGRLAGVLRARGGRLAQAASWEAAAAKMRAPDSDAARELQLCASELVLPW